MGQVVVAKSLETCLLVESLKQLLGHRQAGEGPTEHMHSNPGTACQVWDHVPQCGSPGPVSKPWAWPLM